MYRQLSGILSVLLLALALGGCGSGEKSAGKYSGSSAKAVTKVKTAGLVAPGQTLGAVWLTLSIPPGVTVAIDPLSHEPARGVVTLIGASDPTLVFQSVKYTEATATAYGELQLVVVNAQGFGPLEYIALQLDITPGSFPVASDFSVSNFVVSDIDTYTTIPIANPTVSVTIS